MHKKRAFPLKIFSVNVTKSNLATFTEKILNGNVHFSVQSTGKKYTDQ